MNSRPQNSIWLFHSFRECLTLYTFNLPSLSVMQTVASVIDSVTPSIDEPTVISNTKHSCSCSSSSSSLMVTFTHCTEL